MNLVIAKISSVILTRHVRDLPMYHIENELLPQRKCQTYLYSLSIQPVYQDLSSEVSTNDS